MKKVIEQMDGYRAEVQVTIYASNYVKARNLGDIENNDRVSVAYDIDIEFRSWGIKDITLSFRKPVTIHIVEQDLDSNVVGERDIEVDLSTAQIDWVEGDGYAPYELEVTLDAKGAASEVTMNCYYMKKD